MLSEYSIPSAERAYAECALAMGVAQATDSQELANQKLVEELQALNEELQVPSLREFGSSKNRFDEVKTTMAEQALASGSPSNNPRIPTIDDMIMLYDQLWA